MYTVVYVVVGPGTRPLRILRCGKGPTRLPGMIVNVGADMAFLGQGNKIPRPTGPAGEEIGPSRLRRYLRLNPTNHAYWYILPLYYGAWVLVQAERHRATTLAVCTNMSRSDPRPGRLIVFVVVYLSVYSMYYIFADERILKPALQPKGMIMLHTYRLKRPERLGRRGSARDTLGT